MYSKPIVPRDERWCPHCLSLGHKSIEDEEHFLCECPLYSNLRGIYLNKYKLRLKNDLSGNSLFMFLINSEQRIAGLTAKFIWKRKLNYPQNKWHTKIP
jgi:hypothetical protein